MRIKRPTGDRFSRRSVQLRCAGFTLLELSAVVFIIAVLVSLLCAALNHTKSKALRITCLDNMRELQRGWTMSIVDYDDVLPLNQTAAGPPDPRFLQVRTSTNSWVAGNPRQDTDTENIKKGTFYRLDYVTAMDTYRCPMDDSTVPRQSSILRTRSYSMNSYLGGDAYFNPKYKFGEISRPDNAFVFIEEHESSPWFSSFVVNKTGPGTGRISASSNAAWASTPSDRHSQGCNISFADGHMEYWRWYTPKEASRLPSHLSSASSGLSQARDVMRLQSCLP